MSLNKQLVLGSLIVAFAVFCGYVGWQAHGDRTAEVKTLAMTNEATTNSTSTPPFTLKSSTSYLTQEQMLGSATRRVDSVSTDTSPVEVARRQVEDTVTIKQSLAPSAVVCFERPTGQFQFGESSTGPSSNIRPIVFRVCATYEEWLARAEVRR